MEWFFQGFVLGNGAILTNVCLLPLYPGMIAFLAARSTGQERQVPFLGAWVLAGILTLMIGMGAVLMLLRVAVAAWLPWLLPTTYLIVGAMGVAMLFDVNPFTRLTTGTFPNFRDVRLAAFGYGLLLAPMTLPCTGPIMVAAFVLAAGDPRALGVELGYVLSFGLGFGWPLVLLPLLAGSSQRGITQWLSRHHAATTRVAGGLLVAIAAWGIVTEVVPNLT